MLVAQGNLAEALKSYQDSLAIRDRLAKAEPSNAGWQRYLAVSHGKVAMVLAQQGEAKSALDQFRLARDIIARLKEHLPDDAGLPDILAMLDGEIKKLDQGDGEVAVQPEQVAQ